MKKTLIYASWIAAIATANLCSASVESIVLASIKTNIQSGPNAVEPSQVGTDGPYAFGLMVEETTSYSLFSSITVQSPKTLIGSLVHSSMEWNLYKNYTSASTYQNEFTSGNYTFNFTQTNGSKKTQSLYCPSSLFVFPATPMIQNHGDVFISDASQSIRLNWNAWTSKGLMGKTIFKISDKNGQSVLNSENIYSNGLSTSTSTYTIPMGTLKAGNKYYFDLCFMDMLSGIQSTTFSGAAVGTANSSITRIPFYTAIATSMADRFAVTYNRAMVLNVHAETDDASCAPQDEGTCSYALDYNSKLPKPEVGGIPVTDAFLYNKTLGIVQCDRPSAPVINNEIHYQFRNIKTAFPDQSVTAMINANGDGSCYSGTSSLLPTHVKEGYFVPELQVEGNKLMSVSWTYRDADGNPSTPPTTGTLQVLVTPKGGTTTAFYAATNASSVKVFPYHNIPADNLDSIGFSYAVDNSRKTVIDTTYSVNYTDNLFVALYHEDSWVLPNTDVSDSFGIFSDLLFPYIYNANADILANGSYKADGSGFMYVMPGGSLDGFYAYRYATQTWCWTSYNWSGWIYDYGNATHAAGWLDLTPIQK